MSFRVKDYYKNLIAEFDTFEEMTSYISSSQYTSSLGEDNVSLNYFQYDSNIHTNLLESGSFSIEESKNTIRITYIPGQEDTEGEE